MRPLLPVWQFKKTKDPETQNITDMPYFIFEDGSHAFKNHYSLQ